MKIPITMCHGIRTEHEKPLSAEHLDRLMRIASELRFESSNYDDLAAWHQGTVSLPERPIMFDFDHPMKKTLPLLRNQI